MDDGWVDRQLQVCHRYLVSPFPADDDLKVGISANVRSGLLPIHGMRCPPVGDTTGWYIWAGDYHDDPDFFSPLHVGHLPSWCPAAVPYLQMPPGWRFLVAGDYEDVWYDDELTTV